MKCAIELVFDKNSQKIINDLRKKLSENGVHDEAVSINHVSLADIEIEDNNIHSSEELKKLDLESIKDSDNDNNEDEKIDKFIAQSSRFKLNKEFYDNMYIQEQQIFQHLLNSNKYAKEAYETKYHIDPEDTDAINYIEIPDSVFNDFSLDDEELSQLDYKKLHGNLYDKFMNI